MRVRRVRAEEKLTRERVDEKLVLSEWDDFFTVFVGDLDRGERISFKLKTIDGTTFVSKDEAKKEILRLKEYLDLGIITQEEFDTKAVSLKKMLLGD